MMQPYRKYMEPEYGEVCPKVAIGRPQILDYKNPGEWRQKTNKETIQAITSQMSGCAFYESLMTVRTDNRFIPGEDHNVPVRIYYPDKKENNPIMVFYHGGSFMMNNIDVYDYVHRYFAKFGGVAVVAADYRLAPEFPYPAGVEDAYCALKWTEKNVKSLGGGRDNIIVCGDSSGGNLAAVVSLMARDRKGPAIRKQILVYPVTAVNLEKPTKSELRYGEGYFLEYESLAALLEPYYGRRENRDHPYVSPLCADSLRGLPPACILAAECDPLLDQGLMYAARLQDAGIPVEYRLYKGMIHGFLNSVYSETFEMMEEIGRYCNQQPPISPSI